jgi:predicted transcriptional regulator
MQKPKRKDVIFVDISKTTVITFISKFYSKNLYAIDKKKEFVKYLSNVFDSRRWDRGSVKFITGKLCATTFTTTCKDFDSFSLKNNSKLQLLRQHRLA